MEEFFSRRSTERLLGPLFGLVTLLYLAILVWYREAWIDEQLAVMKGYLYWKGEFLPFVSTIFEYPPLVILSHALPESWFGPSIFVARLVSLVFTAGSIYLLYLFVSRILTLKAATLAVAFFLGHVFLVGTYVAGTAYSMTVFWMLLGVYVDQYLFDQYPTRKEVAVGMFFSLAILSRLNAIPLVVVYLSRSLLGDGFFIACRKALFIFGCVCVGYLPLVWHNPQFAIANMLSPFIRVGVYAGIPLSEKTAVVPLAEFLATLQEFIREYAVILFLYVASIFACVRRSAWSRGTLSRDRSIFLLVSSLLLVSVHFAYPRISAILEYSVYVIPFIFLFICSELAEFCKDRKENISRVLVVACIVLIGMNIYPTHVISSPREETDIERIDRGARALRELSQPTDTILTLDNSILHVFRADRRTFAPLLNRNFFYLPDVDRQKVASFGFYNLEIFRDWMINDADVVLIHEERFPSSITRSAFWKDGTEDVEARLQEIQHILKTRYYVAAKVLNVYPRKYTQGNDGGTMLVYRRLPVQAK